MNNNKTAEVKQHAEHTLDNLVISEQFSTSGLSIEHIKIAILESAASKTLKEIARCGIENGMRTLPMANNRENTTSCSSREQNKCR